MVKFSLFRLKHKKNNYFIKSLFIYIAIKIRERRRSNSEKKRKTGSYFGLFVRKFIDS